MIHVECYADEALVRALGCARRRVRHQASKGDVVNAVRKSEGATGVVDEDPQSAQPGDMANYDVAEASATMRLLARRGSGQQRLVVLCPYLEAWLLARAEANGVDPAQYGLPADPHDLHKRPHYERAQKFADFLTALSCSDDEIKKLRTWLQQAL